MNIFQKLNQQQQKSHIPRILLSLLLFLIILAAQFSCSNPLNAKAAAVTVDGTEWKAWPGEIYWGGSAEKQGVIFYLYNVQGGYIDYNAQPFAFLASYQSNGEAWQNMCRSMGTFQGRKGAVGCDRLVTRPDFPYPATYTEDGSWISTGGDTKSYLEEETSDGKQRWEEIVSNYWPDSKIEEIKKDRDNKYRICIESISAIVPYQNVNGQNYIMNDMQGQPFKICATDRQLGELFMMRGVNITKSTGSSGTVGTANSKWLQSIATGMVFSDTEDASLIRVSTASFSGSISATEMYNKGYGFGTIKPTLTPIHTCNGSTPGPPESPIPDVTDGECTIQKVYWTTVYDKDGNFKEIKDIRSTYRQGTTNYIVIDAERGYTVKKWRTSSGSINPTPTNWSGNGIHSGKGGGSITLDDENNEKYLAVWLEKTVVDRSENKPYDYIIPESQITKRISLDHPDNLRSDRSTPLNTISSHVFNFSAPSVGCPGHLVTWTETRGSGTNTYTVECSRTDYCSEVGWSDNTTKIGIINTLSTSSPSILSKIQQCSLSEKGDTISPTGNTKDLSTTRGGTGAASLSYSGYSFNSIIFRGKDQLVLADWKNAQHYPESKPFLTNISTNPSYNFKSQNTPNGTRYHGNFYYDKFGLNFTNGGNSEVDETTVYQIDGPKCGSQSSSFSLTNPLPINDIIAKVEVYWGEGDGVSGSTGSSELYAGTVSFTPYILMRYDTETQRNKHTFVLSEHPRSLTVYDR